MKKTLFISALVLVAALSSCGDYLDINTDPNSPSEDNITSDMLMPAIEMNIASSYGDFLRITGGYFSEIYAHLNGTSNYLDYSQFQMSATRSSSTYTQFTQRALSNLQTVLEKSEEDEEWGSYLAATVLRAFVYQAMVDCYGEIPYTEALTDNTQPAYDDGEVIYEGILAELDAALEKVSSSDLVCTNFLYPDENASNWIKFANALKLRILMRMVDVADVQSRVAELIAEDNFPDEDIAYTDCWADESGSYSPFYAEEFNTGVQTNVAANVTIIGTMQMLDSEGNIEYTDPRLPAYFEYATGTEYIGSVSGTNYPGTSVLTNFSRPVSSYDMPVYYITVAETEFFLAEYYARYGSSTTAEEHYAAAIEASFETAGVEGAEDHIARYPFSSTNYKQVLGEAKWVHLAGLNTYEAWCELRRLDYPAFGSVTGDDLYSAGDDAINNELYEPFTLYTPISVFAQVGDNQVLERYPYPESSTARNANSPEFPGYTVPVFWAE